MLHCNTPSNLKTKQTLKSTPSHQLTLDVGFVARFHGVGDGIREDIIYDCHCNHMALRSRSQHIMPSRHGRQSYYILRCPGQHCLGQSRLPWQIALANVASANRDIGYKTASANQNCEKVIFPCILDSRPFQQVPYVVILPF